MIKERISSNFAELDIFMTVAEARATLGGGYGAMWDENGRFVSLITPDDLASFADDQSLAAILDQLPPGLLAPAAETMEAFVQSPSFAAFAIGARGAVVYEDEQVIGILTDETITAYVQNEFEPVGEIKGFPPDATLPGSITDKPLVIYCDEFKHRNELKYYNRHKPPACQVKEPYPHLIRRNN